jgi:hypothetical protein
MKTSELQGAALDWAVHTAQGLSDEYFVVVDNLYGPQWRGPEYSTSWQEGGPLIEREKICLTRPRWDGQWTALLVYEDRSFDGVASVEFDAPTPLIAAMRCYVQSRLGDEVEIPEELQ